MSAREWKPGDVAIAYDQDWEFRVVRHRGGMTPDYWSAANGEWPPGVQGEFLDYRPLVVLDPANPDDAETLGAAILAVSRKHVPQEFLEEALRLLVAPATPPKPEEPTGLGAVVEDEDGVRWVLACGPDCSDAMGDGCDPWVEWNGDAARSYADIAAVRVLHEGWSE